MFPGLTSSPGNNRFWYQSVSLSGVDLDQGGRCDFAAGFDNHVPAFWSGVAGVYRQTDGLLHFVPGALLLVRNPLEGSPQPGKLVSPRRNPATKGPLNTGLIFLIKNESPLKSKPLLDRAVRHSAASP